MNFFLISAFIFVFIPTLIAKKIKSSASYCTQYEKFNITLDTDSLKQLDDNQYINKSFKDFFPELKLDYYISYFHIARGLCYYTNEEDIKTVPEIGEFINGEQKLDEIKYDRTVNCYYMYHKIASQEEFAKIKPPCQNIFVKFFNSMFYFLSNETLCPYPQREDRVALGNNDAVLEARNEYLTELRKLYEEEIENKDIKCEDPDNVEIFNCGYTTQIQKNNYCFNRPRDSNIDYECCFYKTLYQRYTEIVYDISTEAIISGSVTTLFFLLVGMYFSYYYIKEIKNQKSIMKTVAEQEKMYLNNSRQQMLDLNTSNISSGNYSANYSLEGYHSNNNARQSLSIDQHHSLPIVSNTSPQMKSIRSPQPLPYLPADISNIRPNANSSNLYVKDRPASVISSSSPSVTPRGASLAVNRPTSSISDSSLNINSRLSSLSKRRSSVDISSHLNVPLDTSFAPSPDGPRAISTKPVSPKLNTPRLSVNGSPIPTTPNTPIALGTPATLNSTLPPLSLTLPSELDVPFTIDGTMDSKTSHNTK